MNMRSLATKSTLAAAVYIAALTHGGCATPRSSSGEPPPAVAAIGEALIAPTQLDELTRAFADSYVGLLYTVCDDLRANSTDPVQRREAQTLLVDTATNVYDIASNRDAFTSVLDLVVLTTLTSQVWVDGGRAARSFGNHAAPTSRALLRGRAEALELAGRVLTSEELGALEFLIRDWWRDSPGITRVSFIRFSSFAIGRGRDAAAELTAAGGLFANLQEELRDTSQSVDDARLLGERVFWQLKRQATLLRWQVAAVKEDVFATPAVGSAAADLGRLVDQFEQLPKNVATERQAFFSALDEGRGRADGTITNVRAALSEADDVAASVQQASESLTETFKAADVLAARFAGPGHTPSRPFDVREFTEGVEALTVTVEGMNDVIESSDRLLTSPEWTVRPDELARALDGRIALVSKHGHELLRDLALGLCLVLFVLFGLLLCYRLTLLSLARRFSATAEREEP